MTSEASLNGQEACAIARPAIVLRQGFTLDAAALDALRDRPSETERRDSAT
jgi:hypothetical protein